MIGEASGSIEGVRKAQELQPDLILFDIGLPTLNGIEGGSPNPKTSICSKILFMSAPDSVDMAREALNTGNGYV
ncbi:MAG TPA: response regulator, partial [Terriglobales bacterium]|nr:response regulator [Terriglobales bacterium]